MKQKTAIRRLIEILESALNGKHDSEIYEDTLNWVIKEAEALESVNEQQFKDAYNQGYADGYDSSQGDGETFESSEQYFNETFEKP